MNDKVFIKSPDDAIRVHPIGDVNLTPGNNPGVKIHCSTCGETRSVKYYINKDGKTHFLCNKCALTRNFSLDYYNSIKDKIEDDFKPSFTESDYKPSFAVRLYRASNNHDIAEMRYLGGISKRVDLTVNGYSCLKEVNGYTLFYDEREEYLKSHMIPIGVLHKVFIIVIEYGENFTPMAHIVGPDIPGYINTFRFTDVEEFNKKYIGLIDRIDSDNPIYFMDTRNKAPFDDFMT